PRRKTRRLRHEERRKELATSRCRFAQARGMVDGEAASHDRGRARSGGTVLRYHERRVVDEPRRRQALGFNRTPPSRNLRGRGGTNRMSRPRTLSPSPLAGAGGGERR